MSAEDVDRVSDASFEAVEAGAYWCLTKFLSDIQDHYTNGQPGIQQMVAKLGEIVHRAWAGVVLAARAFSMLFSGFFPGFWMVFKVCFWFSTGFARSFRVFDGFS